jgi:hypothetical protein
VVPAGAQRREPVAAILAGESGRRAGSPVGGGMRLGVE